MTAAGKRSRYALQVIVGCLLATETKHPSAPQVDNFQLSQNDAPSLSNEIEYFGIGRAKDQCETIRKGSI